jgi:aspartyl-tRNA(Asn)/glutamyl-tRNA(Gln) amidotransferase subunit A
MNWLGMTAADLGRAIGAGKISAVEVTEAFLDAIAAHPEAGRIYARTTPRRARSMAIAAHDRARAGRRIGPLDGVPLSWKDNIDAAGTACEGGSALLAGRVPQTDAAVLRTATAQGAVCLGKTHMAELAFSGLGLNPVIGTPPNRNFPGAVPGGSSSGAAASVAFGLAPAAVGSDTGGSVRIPAVWNDLVGFKTTHGRLSVDGVLPLCARFDTVGALARSVEDCALMLALMEGGAAADLTGATLGGLRLAVLDTVAFDHLRPEPGQGFETAADRLARAGARLVHLQAPEAAEAMTLTAPLFTGEAWATWRHEIERAPDLMFPRILERFRLGGAVTAADFVAAWQRLDRLRAAWAARVAEFDAVILPTAPILPPDIARLMTDDTYYVTENLLALQNTRIGNLLGLCAVTLPTGTPSAGLMLMGAAGQDARLLRIAAAAERALG